MTTQALSNNLNELDILLQDLSAARYSGHVETHETVTESRSYSSSTAAPRPPERSVKTSLTSPGPRLSNGDTLHSVHHYDVHAVERSRNEGREGSVGSDGDQSKWEYMGYGIWENRDSDSDLGQGVGGWTSNTSTTTRNQFNSTHNSDSDQGDGRGQGQGWGNNSFSSSMSRTQFNSSSMSHHHNNSLDNGTGGSASTATAELDHLMTSLNNFKMDGRNVDEPVIGGAPNLDMMLGDLQEDMDKQGIKTKQKGVCGACQKPIVGQVITALGRTWHPEHFCCSQCNQELGTQNFFERDGKPYCEQCYQEIFSPRCAGCGGAILDKCISALDQTWHPECFLCFSCGKQLGDDGFHEREDAAYCKECYYGQFAPKCGGCTKAIMDNYISALNMQWCPDCFVCKECQQPFDGGSFYEHEGFPYCENHYHALRGSLCAGCHKPIQGRCITAMFRKFHPEHFVCSFCLKQLNKGTFKEQGDKPYCHDCFDRLFG